MTVQLIGGRAGASPQTEAGASPQPAAKAVRPARAGLSAAQAAVPQKRAPRKSGHGNGRRQTAAKAQAGRQAFPPAPSEAQIAQAVQFIERALVKKQVLPAALKKNLVIRFLSSRRIRELNKKFLGKDKATDILSFSPLEKGGLGELALCSEQIRVRAGKHGLTVEEETVYVILHGILHLLGYRHEEGGAPARKMYKIQDDVFALWLSSRRKSPSPASCPGKGVFPPGRLSPP